MRRFGFHPGVWVGSLGLTFGGVFAVLGASEAQPALTIAGWVSIAAGVLLAIWGIKFDGEHWWNFKRRRKRGNITLADAIRRMGHGSQWSLDAELVGPRDWPKYATQEMLDALSRGDLEAWGRWRPTYGAANMAVTKIAAAEWAMLVPEISLIIDRRVSLANRRSPTNEGAGLYHEITLDRGDVERLWPRWSLGARIKRRLAPDTTQSFAEKFQQLQVWRNGNDHLPKRSEYYWHEPK